MSLDPDRKTRVLLVSNTLSCGGAERQLVMLANALQQSGEYEADALYYAQKNGPFAARVPKAIFVDKEKLGFFKTIRTMKKIMREGDYDVVQSFGGTANIYGRLSALCARRKVIIGALRGRSLVGSLNRFFNNLINLFCKDWVVNNPALIPYLKQHQRFVRDERIRLIYNGFEPRDSVDYAPDRQTDFDLDRNGRFVFTTIGRLAGVKNHKLLLTAFAKVHQSCPDARLWIIGDGEDMERLSALARELCVDGATRFWGFRSDTDAALFRTDVYVQSSDREGTSNSVLEAMRAQKPVVTTACTDLSLTVRDGESGLIVPVGDAEKLADAMLALYRKTADERAAMGRAGYQLFQASFTEERSALEYRRLFSELLEAKKR